MYGFYLNYRANRMCGRKKSAIESKWKQYRRLIENRLDAMLQMVKQMEVVGLSEAEIWALDSGIDQEYDDVGVLFGLAGEGNERESLMARHVAIYNRMDRAFQARMSEARAAAGMEEETPEVVEVASQAGASAIQEGNPLIVVSMATSSNESVIQAVIQEVEGQDERTNRFQAERSVHLITDAEASTESLVSLDSDTSIRTAPPTPPPSVPAPRSAEAPIRRVIMRNAPDEQMPGPSNAIDAIAAPDPNDAFQIDESALVPIQEQQQFISARDQDRVPSPEPEQRHSPERELRRSQPPASAVVRRPLTVYAIARNALPPFGTRSPVDIPRHENIIGWTETFVRRPLRPGHFECPYCGENHGLYSCFRFLRGGLVERWYIALTCGICLNCCRPGHSSRTCVNAGPCTRCDLKHNSVLCWETYHRRA